MKSNLTERIAWAFSPVEGQRKKAVAVIAIGLTLFILLGIVVPIVVEWKPRANNLNKSDYDLELNADLLSVGSNLQRKHSTALVWGDDGLQDSNDSKEAAEVLVPVGTQSAGPSLSPSNIPSSAPSFRPTMTVNVTFYPGWLTHEENGLLLSSGLTARILAQSGEKVVYADGSESSVNFHDLPDFGAAFADTRADNPRGWIYVSNSEVQDGQGGVGALTFDANGNLIKYEMVLTGTTMNCGGGRSPWGTWISCEETDSGRAYQVHPGGLRDPGPIILGKDGGHWESFSYDIRDLNNPHFYITEDADRGAMVRFTAYEPDWTRPWEILDLQYANGTIDYLVLEPTSRSGGNYSWTTSRDDARDNALIYYPNTEGIDVDGSNLYFVCKGIKQIFELNLDDGTYTNRSTVSGLFDGEPDQLKRIMAQNSENYLFFTEEGGKDAGIHGRNKDGAFFTLLESPIYEDETTGLAFSPDAMHLYVAYQKNGLLFDVTRTDGLSFGAKTLNVKFHAAADN